MNSAWVYAVRENEYYICEVCRNHVQMLLRKEHNRLHNAKVEK